MARRSDAEMIPVYARGLQLIRAGASLRDAAALVGCAPTSLNRKAIDAGITMGRGRGAARARAEQEKSGKPLAHPA